LWPPQNLVYYDSQAMYFCLVNSGSESFSYNNNFSKINK
jgi:hypothetical protein